MKSQSKLSEDKKTKNINARHNVQTVGFEIEFYSEKNIKDTGNHINNKLKLDNLETIKDESVYDYVEEIKDGKPTNPMRDKLEANPCHYEFSMQSDISKFGKEFGMSLPEYAEFTKNTTNETANALFKAMSDSPEINQKIINKYDESLKVHDKYVTRKVQRTGVEVRLESPVKLQNVPYALDALNKVCTDKLLNAKFTNPENGRSDRPEMSGENHGLVGLHVHFGVSPQIEHSPLDLLRLLLIAKKHESDIETLGKRKHNRWAKKMDPIINDVSSAIGRLVSGAKTTTIRTKWFEAHNGTNFSLEDPRYYGVNVTNIGTGTHRRGNHKKLNTIEFRWASTEVCSNLGDLTAYFNLLQFFMDHSFTGETEMKWGEYTLRDISDTSKKSVVNGSQLDRYSTILVIDKNDKVLGRMSFDSLCETFRTKLPNKSTVEFNESQQDILSDSYVPRFRTIAQRELLGRLYSKNVEDESRKVVLSTKKMAGDANTRNILTSFRKNSSAVSIFDSNVHKNVLESAISNKKLARFVRLKESKEIGYDDMKRELTEKGKHTFSIDRESILADIK